MNWNKGNLKQTTSVLNAAGFSVYIKAQPLIWDNVRLRRDKKKAFLQHWEIPTGLRTPGCSWYMQWVNTRLLLLLLLHFPEGIGIHFVWHSALFIFWTVIPVWKGYVSLHLVIHSWRLGMGYKIMAIWGRVIGLVVGRTQGTKSLWEGYSHYTQHNLCIFLISLYLYLEKCGWKDILYTYNEKLGL